MNIVFILDFNTLSRPTSSDTRLKLTFRKKQTLSANNAK